MTRHVLHLENVTVAYGGLEAVRRVALRVDEGEIVALVGPNGAGKSTILRSIVGLEHPCTGTIRYRGDDITTRPTEDLVRDGIALVPENRRIFMTLSVEDNVHLAVRRELARGTRAHVVSEVFDRFPTLAERRTRPAGLLSGGQQQLLAIARGLASRPRLLLLDEPSLGLSPTFVAEVFELVAQLRRDGITVLLIEQNASRAVALADRSYVLHAGVIRLEGARNDLHGSRLVEKAYLGG